MPGAGIALLGAVALAAATAPPAAATGHRFVRASSVVRQVAAGLPVAISHETIRGELRLPAHVAAPLVLHRVTLLGPIVASSTTFDKLVDLSGSTLGAGADFSGATFAGPAVFVGLHGKADAPLRFDFASFRGSALFSGASFAGRTSFSDAEFDKGSSFRGDSFGGLARFDSDWFGDAAVFASATFNADASFNAVDFHGAADFSGVQFGGQTEFRAARFSQFADFIGTTFGGSSQGPASFQSARFGAGASFLDAEFDGEAHFELAQSVGDLVFDGADFESQLSFSTAQLLGAETFSQATFYGSANFDQATLQRLDLNGAKFESKAATVSLPKPGGSIGHLDELRFDPADVGHFGIGHGPASDAEQEHALALAESAALRGGDAKAANQAQEKRWTLMRGDRDFPLRALDWALLWGVGGYLVLPWHQVGTVAVLLALGAAIRVGWARYKHKPRVSFRSGLAESWGAFWRPAIRQGTFWQQAESQLYNLVTLVFLLSLANVWPLGHDLVKGVLP